MGDDEKKSKKSSAAPASPDAGCRLLGDRPGRPDLSVDPPATVHASPPDTCPEGAKVLTTIDPGLPEKLIPRRMPCGFPGGKWLSCDLVLTPTRSCMSSTLEGGLTPQRARGTLKYG
jgi:hypothetical protein